MSDRIAIHVRRREGDERPSRDDAETAPPRSRVGRALVCPYCRDEVRRRNAVGCAQRSCGALYHRACWSECAGQYGGCAIWGCGSQRAREISGLAYVLFFVKLFVAALFLPPSLARHVSEASEESLPGVAVRAFHACRKVLPDRWTVGGATLGIALLFSVAVVGVQLQEAERTHGDTFRASFALAIVGAITLPALAAFAWTIFLVWFIPFLAVVVALTVRSLARLLAFAFRGALPALARADGGLTVLERLRRGPRAK